MEMRPKKSDNVHLRYEDFSNVYDRAWQARTTGWSAQEASERLGIQVTLNGDYLQREVAAYSRNANNNALQRSYSTDPRNYRGPDVPYEHEYENQYKPRVKPKA
ncbi:MAG: hypothetical protein JSS07_05215 [Proteobacteria bacterium]|nr:hypothetical protein [Pseudomonadota bacterium]